VELIREGEDFSDITRRERLPERLRLPGTEPELYHGLQPGAQASNIVPLVPRAKGLDAAVKSAAY
jgi:hypothetical protein